MNKEEAYQKCISTLASKITEVRSSLDSVKSAKENEGKSSVGDKYETGRAMMQIEEERLSRQLAELIQMNSLLISIDPHRKSSAVESGALVRTNLGVYFITIPLGKIEVKGETIYCMSVHAPISKSLLDKQVGDSISFNSKEIKIETIE